jgi:hypothetical protein
MAWQEPPEGMITEHFAWSEAACRHCGLIPDETDVRETAEWLERIREVLEGRVVHVNAWARCEEHTASIGGAHGGAHGRGTAVDITVRGLSPHETFVLLREHQGEGGLVGALSENAGFTHVERGLARA